MIKTDYSTTLKDYYELTKPGIIYGNVLTATAGYLYASADHIPGTGLFSTLLGTALVIAGACVINNFLDRSLDERMARTRHRASVRGTISLQRGLTVAGILVAGGFFILLQGTNMLVVGVGAAAFIIYTLLYAYAKRYTIYGTAVGSLAGAAPILAGYCAYTNHIGLSGIILFMILILWQMAHFQAIALYRVDDYRAAQLPVVSTRRAGSYVRTSIMVYIALFAASCLALSYFGRAGVIFSLVLIGMSGYWFIRGLRLPKTTTDAMWGKSMFRISLYTILVFSCAVAVAQRLP